MLDRVMAAHEPLVAVTGPAGVGKTTLLAQLSAKLTTAGYRVTAVSCTRGGDLLPFRFAVDGSAEVRLSSDDDTRGWAPIGPVAGAAGDADIAARAASAITSRLSRGGGKVLLLIDDAQYLDPDTLAVVHALVPSLAGTPVRCVLSARTPAPAASAKLMSAAMRDLRSRGLVAHARLLPNCRTTVAREAAKALDAVPEPALTRLIHDVSRGVPAHVNDTIDALCRNATVRVIARRAYLATPHGPVRPSHPKALTDPVRELGEDCWETAKALAVFAPLGAAVPALVAEALDVPQADAADMLDRLRGAGVVHRGRHGTTWRFVVPLVGTAILAELGPFERRRLAAAAVTAVWLGEATGADEDYVADRIADAGGLVDRDRAVRQLFRHAARVHRHRPGATLRWLSAGTTLARGSRQQALTLALAAAAHFAAGEHQAGLDNARRVADELQDSLSSSHLQWMHAAAVAGLAAAGEHDALQELTSERRQPGRAERSVVTRALAYCLLDRWQEAAELLRTRESDWRTKNSASAWLGGTALAIAELCLGSPTRFAQLTARPNDDASSRPAMPGECAELAVSTLLVLGERDAAERTLTDGRVDERTLAPDTRALLAAARDQADEALDLAMRTAAGAEAHAHRTHVAGAQLHAVSLLVARGELTAARLLLEAARQAPPPLAHLLDLAQARIDHALGDADLARERLRQCVAYANTRGLAIGLELALSELAEDALDHGDQVAARGTLSQLEQLNRDLPTERTAMLTLLTRACVTSDADTAALCLAMAHERGSALEFATVSQQLVRHGLVEPDTLTDAYTALGTVDAMLYRAWLRNLMRDAGVSVPGRKETLAENEHLLAMLAAGGLTNKQLAATLRASEKSVEGRLSRLFNRTGYRSRIELSTALLTGEFAA